MLYEDDGITQLDGFVSDDGKHVIRWIEGSWEEIPGWWCVTHNQPYYSVCALQDDLPKRKQ